MERIVLSLRDLHYDETELNIELYASNDDTSVTQDFYCYVQELQQFGSALSNFPSSLNSEVRFEIGRRSSDWAYFVSLHAFVYNNRGHSALEIEVDRHADAPYGHSAHFYILCEPASLNRLGEKLVAWCRKHQSDLEWSLSSA